MYKYMQVLHEHYKLTYLLMRLHRPKGGMITSSHYGAECCALRLMVLCALRDVCPALQNCVLCITGMCAVNYGIKTHVLCSVHYGRPRAGLNFKLVHHGLRAMDI